MIGVELKNATGSKTQVDVIVTCFNDVDTILAALEGVKLQKTDCISDVYVIDNTSTDGSWNVIENFCAKNEKFKCFQQVVPGVSAARNMGISKTRAKYIAFLDGDDCWVSNKIQNQTTFMESAKSGFSFSDVLMKNGKTEQVFSCLDTPGGLKEQTEFLLRFSPAIFPSTIMARREVFVEFGGFDEEFLKGQDTLFCLHASTVTQMHRIPEALTVRNIRQGSLGAGYDKKRWYLRKAICKFLNRYPEYGQLKKDALYAIDMHFLRRASVSAQGYSRLMILQILLRHILRRSMYQHVERLVFKREQ